MPINTKKPEKIARIATIAILCFLAAWGLLLVVMPLRPFWTDEWRILYNLKFKSPAALWGPLDYTQQFPRVYLQCMRAILSAFDYSYLIIRLPSYIVGCVVILLCYHLMNKIYRRENALKYLFVIILVSSYTFTEYFVQIKQYTMEILLSLAAIWQLLQLLEINNNGGMRSGWRYALLCLTFLVVPFFSYTYPIAAAPIFMVVGIQEIRLLQSRNEMRFKLRILLLQWFPLLLLAGSIVAFYVVDVAHLMADKEMHGYWSYRMMQGGSGAAHLIMKFWDLFAEVGSGFVFELIFGLLGISAFVYGIYKWGKNASKPSYSSYELLRLYGILLIAIAIALFLCGKLPVEPKFNAFTVPSISILIIYLLTALCRAPASKKLTIGITVVLFAGLIGNIISTAINLVTAPEYAKRIKIYAATEKAIVLAQANKLPIMVTPGVAYPDAITVYRPFFAPISAAAVLKTFPAYKASQNLPVYTIPDMNGITEQMTAQLPSAVTKALVGDGLIYNEATVR